MTLDYRNREVEEDARGTLMISKQYGNQSWLSLKADG